MSGSAAGSRIPTKTPWAWAWATFFGAGLLQPGPGTWGSLAATLLWFAYARLLHPDPLRLHWVTAAAALLALVTGIPAATIVARETGREDPGHVVLDEVVGQWIALAVCPPEWIHALIALLLFRVFDILKPPPARQLERLPGGWGIMMDDVAAGIFALLVMLVLRHWY